MGEQSFQVELRLAFDAQNILQHRILSDLAGNELVVGARLHAMRRGEEKVARDRGCGAGGATGTQHHHH